MSTENWKGRVAGLTRVVQGDLTEQVALMHIEDERVISVTPGAQRGSL